MKTVNYFSICSSLACFICQGIYAECDKATTLRETGGKKAKVTHITKPISVHHEWGELKEVIIGIADDVIVPSYCQGLHVLEAECVEFSKKYGGRRLVDVDRESQKAIVKQVNELAKILEDRGISSS